MCFSRNLIYGLTVIQAQKLWERKFSTFSLVLESFHAYFFFFLIIFFLIEFQYDDEIEDGCILSSLPNFQVSLCMCVLVSVWVKTNEIKRGYEDCCRTINHSATNKKMALFYDIYWTRRFIFCGFAVILF